MDQYSPASVTVPANMSTVEISEFPDNGTSIVANREYTITVSAISDQGTSYPSDPFVVSKLSCLCIHDYKHYLHFCVTSINLAIIIYNKSILCMSRTIYRNSTVDFSLLFLCIPRCICIEIQFRVGELART